MVLLLLLRPPDGHYCSVAAVALPGHGHSYLLCQELVLLQLWRRWLTPHPLETPEGSSRGRSRSEMQTKCGKSDQDPASSCRNGNLQWAFRRAALQVVMRPYRCSPAISAGQRRDDTEINDKAPHNISCIRSCSQHRGKLKILLQESTSLCITIRAEASFTIFTPCDYDTPWLGEQPANRWVNNGLHMLFGIWFYPVLWRQKTYAFWRIYCLEIIYFTLKENQS